MHIVCVTVIARLRLVVVWLRIYIAQREYHPSGRLMDHFGL